MSATKCPPVAGSAFRAASLALAALLLGNQVLLAVESTEGAGLYARSSAVSVMVALAILPVCFEYARRIGAYILATGIALVAVLFLAYAGPATLTRVAEPRAAAAMVQQEYNQAKIEYGQARLALEACKAQRKACGTAERDVDRTTVAVDAARERLGSGAGDVGADTLAGWTGATPAVVRQVSTGAYVLGIELGIALLFALAFRRLPEACPVVEPEKVEEKQPKALTGAEWIAAYIAGQTEPVCVEDAHAQYVTEWDARGKRTMALDKFTTLFQREAKRRGLVIRQAGRRRLYAVA